jgi:site-specific recombinase XerD
MATVKTILYKSKKLSNGEHPVMLRITNGKKRKFISLGFSCSIQDWDSKESLPRKKHPHFFEIQALIQRKKQELTTELFKIKLDERQIDLSSLTGRLKRGGRGKVTLMNYFEEVQDKLKSKGRVGYAAIFKSVRNSLKIFLKGGDILLTKIDLKFLEDYETWLCRRNVSVVGRSAYFRTFRTLYKMAMGDDLINKEKYPFKDFAFSKYNDPETQPRSISKEEVDKLFALNPEEGSRTFHSLNYMKFSFYTYGMNFIDVAKLKWSQINNGVMEYVRSKTKRRMIIALLPQAQQILNYYKLNYHSQDGLVFPILNDSSVTPLKLHHKIISKRKEYNDDLKRLQKEANISFNLTSYVARHSFAFICYRGGVEKKAIGEALGHNFEETTNKYIGKLDKNYISESILNALK